ncbi:damage-inducible protein [Sulfuricella sp. T08]|uniref:competence/damage-inducible protein A n=1 Tax=Sulfuricella sp. T08 TaxID=1632857 RepID=UPI0006179D0B|nr:molybdopterin-binding protein [Sulfuricella sp. T08]GAO37393.1 damage-inducible protein [Sulfuricella sp. T08]
MNFGAIIIGDELLSGKRQDRHFQRVIETLAQRGLELKWCRIIGDDPALIIATLRQTLPQDDIVFSFGGIGATPDDHTRQCAAEAAGVPLIRHPDAVAEIEARFGTEAYPRRILMADLAQGSRIIPNPFNRVPGFSLHHHHFLPGFPQMAWPMMDWVLDTLYPGIRNQAPETEAVITVLDAMESPLLDLMNEFVRRYPDLRFSSLPHIGEEGERKVEFGLRGSRPLVIEGMNYLKAEVEKLGFRWTETTTV